MKKIIFLVFVSFFSLSLYSQTYKKISDNTNKWNYLDQAFTTCCGGEARTYSFFLTSDTTISDTVYKKVMCKIIKHNSTDTVYTGGLREDTILQSVFIRTEENKEKLLYSFDVEVGDTISIDTTYWKDAYTIRYIKSIDTYDFDGFQGKKIGICDTTFRTDGRMPPSESFTDFWYEGIGSLKSLFDLSHIGGFGVEMELLCFWNNYTQFYQSPDWSVCEYAIITAIEETSLNSNLIQIYPNPTTAQIEIKTNEKIKEVSIINIEGRQMIKQSELIIDMQPFPNGIYLVRIKLADNQYVTKRIIKNAL
jgi:hypothetical protein